METWDAVTSRRNVREFSDRPLPEPALERILQAAWRAPSANNLQPWDFVVVTERDQLVALSEVWRGGGHIAKAAAAVAIVTDAQQDERTRFLTTYDVGQAALQMMVVAADFGIGSGHSAVGEQELTRQILGHPADKTVMIIIDFGYPADRPLKPIKKPNRRPFEEVIHRGSW
ncbi:MAG: nitroreductase family protein [Solirubrobacteraceae bacterium]